MKKILAVLAMMLMSTVALAQVPTTITNTITSPTDGEVNQIPYEPYTIPMTGVATVSGGTDTEIVITLDESGSIDSGEWALEKQGAQHLVNRLRNPVDMTKLLAPVGLVGFGYNGYIELSPPSTNYNTVTTAITNWTPDRGLTNFHDGIAKTRQVFNHDGHGIDENEVCFFFSNGSPTTGPDFRPQADAAHGEGILFNSFGIASGANETTLKYIAGTTGVGGDSDDHYWYAPSFGQLQAAIDAAIPATGGVALDRVEVYVDDVYVGDATIAPGGLYSKPVDIMCGPNVIKTIAYTDTIPVLSAVDQVTKYGECDGTPPIPEPGTILLMSVGLVGLGGLALRRKLRK
jgi:hypothetical protein